MRRCRVRGTRFLSCGLEKNGIAFEPRTGFFKVGPCRPGFLADISIGCKGLEG